jgi:hypothetical protein
MRADAGSVQLREAAHLAGRIRSQLERTGDIPAATQEEFRRAVAELAPDEAAEIARQLMFDASGERPPPTWDKVTWSYPQPDGATGTGLGSGIEVVEPITLGTLDRARGLGLLTPADLRAAIVEASTLIKGSDDPATTLRLVSKEISSTQELPFAGPTFDWAFDLHGVAQMRSNELGAELVVKALNDGLPGAENVRAANVMVFGRPLDFDGTNIDIWTTDRLSISRHHPIAIELQKLIDANPKLVWAVVGAATNDDVLPHSLIQLLAFRDARNKGKLDEAAMVLAISQAQGALGTSDRPAELLVELNRAFESTLADHGPGGRFPEAPPDIDWRSPLRDAASTRATRLALPLLLELVTGKPPPGKSTRVLRELDQSSIRVAAPTDEDLNPVGPVFVRLKTKDGRYLNRDSAEAAAIRTLLAGTPAEGARIGEPTQSEG